MRERRQTRKHAGFLRLLCLGAVCLSAIFGAVGAARFGLFGEPGKKEEELLPTVQEWRPGELPEPGEREISHSDRRGWRRIEGRLYYFDPADGTGKEGWIHHQGSWYYLMDGALLKEWNQIRDISGKTGWYYFDSQGKMLADTRTPDGYFVDDSGAYVQEHYSKRPEKPSENRNEPPFEKKREEEVNGYPAELFMLSIAGETSGRRGLILGDRGRAYGICQMDYRSALTEFMRYAYKVHPRLWPAFGQFQECRAGDRSLVENPVIEKAFRDAMEVDYETAVSDQLMFFASAYWERTFQELERAGLNISGRNVAVAAAIFSVTVNCGPYPEIFKTHLDPQMTDEEMIRKVYHLRNTIFAGMKVGDVTKGTSKRYQIAEPRMAMDLLYGNISIDSIAVYGHGVEWHGNILEERKNYE